jgi:hypothetical protein
MIAAQAELLAGAGAVRVHGPWRDAQLDADLLALQILLISTLRNYVEAMGGDLQLIARFPDRPAVASPD